MTFGVIFPNLEYAKETAKIRGKRKFVTACKAGADWLAEEHNFVLMRGDQNTGRVMKMLGSEAKRLNSEYEKKFWKSLDTNKSARLYRWKWNDPVPEEKRFIARRKR